MRNIFYDKMDLRLLFSSNELVSWSSELGHVSKYSLRSIPSVEPHDQRNFLPTNILRACCGRQMIRELEEVSYF